MASGGHWDPLDRLASVRIPLVNFGYLFEPSGANLLPGSLPDRSRSPFWLILGWILDGFCWILGIVFDAVSIPVSMVSGTHKTIVFTKRWSW